MGGEKGEAWGGWDEPAKDLDDLSASNEEEASPRTQILLKRLEKTYQVGDFRNLTFVEGL